MTKFPFYAKASLLLVGLYLLTSILYRLQDILLPIIYAMIISILVSPIINYLVKKKINRTIAIAGVLIAFLIIISAIFLLIISQASMLTEALPRLSSKFQLLLKQCVSWASDYFNISVRSINRWINDTQSDLFNSKNIALGETLSTVGGVMATIFLTPVYIFMLLFYKPHLIEFMHKVFGSSNDNKISEILAATKSIIRNYLLGLFAEFSIVATLNSIGLIILQVDYAILFGVSGAILNLIPYLGGLIAILIFMVIALLTKPPIYVLYVLVLYAVIQFIDNNFIVPKVVGSKVKLNALICLLAVILGAALWGIPGMFLSIPLTAILKLVFDRINDLKPWGFLLGDTTPPLIQFKKKTKPAA